MTDLGERRLDDSLEIPGENTESKTIGRAAYYVRMAGGLTDVPADAVGELSS